MMSNVAGVLLFAMSLAGVTGCHGDDDGGGDGDGDIDVDADSDADGDADTDPCPGELELAGATGGTGLCWSEQAEAHGDVHRARAVACAPDESFSACALERSSCSTDADCTTLGDGHCVGSWDNCQCVYACSTDEDCGAGWACLCHAAAPEREAVSVFSQCVPATCRSDADCGGFPCSVDVDCCQSPLGLRCHGPEDECQSNADCPRGNDCAWGDNRWQCLTWCSCE